MINILIRDTGVKITDILDMIGQGYTRKEITDKFNLQPSDIMLAAQLACEIISKMASQKNGTVISAKTELVVKNGMFQSLEEIRKDHPRAFVKWSGDEDKELLAFHNSGKSLKEIAELLQRTRGSIRARLEKFGITFD